MTAEREVACHAALNDALAAGYAVLERGGASLDAVVAAVTVLEDSPLFNAGKGAVLNSDGVAELDASLMDGRTQAAGAVTCVQRIRNPIQLARLVMEHSPHVLLAGEGAERFAREQGVALVRNSYFITDRRRRELEQVRSREQNRLQQSPRSARREGMTVDLEGAGLGTVGAVALDRHGHLAAATSTGGRTNKRPGRIGDSPIVGAGTYALDGVCAVSGTGHGEYFMRTVAGHNVASLIQHRRLGVAEATAQALRQIEQLGGTGGLIAIDAKGRIALPFNTPGMYRGWRLGGQPPVTEIYEPR
jgi:beta-aspartyl-peptidase (threonine type)